MDEATSARAARALIAGGYDKDRLAVLLGGIRAWHQAGASTEPRRRRRGPGGAATRRRSPVASGRLSDGHVERPGVTAPPAPPTPGPDRPAEGAVVPLRPVTSSLHALREGLATPNT